MVVVVEAISLVFIRIPWVFGHDVKNLEETVTPTIPLHYLLRKLIYARRTTNFFCLITKFERKLRIER